VQTGTPAGACYVLRQFNVVVVAPTMSDVVLHIINRQLMESASSSVHVVIFQALITGLLLPLGAGKYVNLW